MDRRNILRHKSHVITKSYMLGMGGVSSRNRVAPTPPPIPPVPAIRIIHPNEYGINWLGAPIRAAQFEFINDPIADARYAVPQDNFHDYFLRQGRLPQVRPTSYPSRPIPVYGNVTPLTQEQRNNFLNDDIQYQQTIGDYGESWRPANSTGRGIRGVGVRPAKGSQEMKDKMSRVRSMRKK